MGAWWNMNEGYLTIPEISKETGIPESTARRYLEQHNHALRTKKTGRGAWLLNVEDVQLMNTIRTCYEQKMSVNEVENYLLQSGQPITITIDDEQQQVITPAVAFMKMAEEMQSLKNEVVASREQLKAAYQEISNLKNEVAASKEQSAAAYEEISNIKGEIVANQEQSAAAYEEIKGQIVSVSQDLISRLERGQQEREQEQQKGFWQRLFGR
jgi:predicted transcriptional regulator